jgi:magnesium-transporting ATPase (P-type)
MVSKQEAKISLSPIGGGGSPHLSIALNTQEELKFEFNTHVRKVVFMALVVVQFLSAFAFFVVIFFEHVEGFAQKWVFYIVSVIEIGSYILIETFGLHSAHLLHLERLKIYQIM